MAVAFIFLFNGVVQRLIKMGVPKPIVLVFLLAFIFMLFYFLGAMIFASASSFSVKFPVYEKKVTEMFLSIIDQLKITQGEVSNYIDSINWTEAIEKYTSTLTKVLTRTFGSFAKFIGNLILVLVFLMFLLAGRTSLTDRVKKAFKGERGDKLKRIINSIEDQVQHYLLIKTMISLLTGVVSGLILFFFGIDFVILAALLIFVLNFIPNFGSVIATAFPVLVGIVQYGFTWRVLFVTIGLMGAQFVIGNIIEPKITGKSLDLSPIVILISLIFWGYVWGVIGMILAVPLTATIKIAFENIPSLKPFAELISSD